MTTTRDLLTRLRHRGAHLVDDRRRAALADLGQTAIVAVLGVTLIIGIIGATLVTTVIQSIPLQQANAVSVYAHRAMQAGENAYVTAVNANPTLAQCNTSTNGSGLCSGIDYGKWNLVPGSQGTDSYDEYYAFGNPQPTFDPTTNALTSLTVQVVGAAHDPGTTTNYIFDSQNIHLTAQNGFLTNVWWSNFESYNSTGNYSGCKYNWQDGYNIDNGDGGCGPVYFGPNDYLFGPVYTNDSVFVSGGAPPPPPTRPRSVPPPSPPRSARPYSPPTPTACSSTTTTGCPAATATARRPTARSTCTTRSTASPDTRSSPHPRATPSSGSSPPRTAASTPVPPRSRSGPPPGR